MPFLNKLSSTAAVTPSPYEMLKPIMLKHQKAQNSKQMLKPRPNVLFGDKLGKDNFVPGADPTNFFEQDRKLGYQKSRTWFPAPALSTLGLLPPDRSALASTKKISIVDQVVEEYCQMRALISYMGDLVLPYEPANAFERRSVLSSYSRHLVMPASNSRLPLSSPSKRSRAALMTAAAA